MIGNGLEQEIIGLYSNNLTALYSINQISQKLKKAYPYINKKVNDLINYGVLNKVIIGRSHLCSLNLESDDTRILLTINDVKRKRNFLENKEETAIALTGIQRELTPSLILWNKDHFLCILKQDPQTPLPPTKEGITLIREIDFLKQLPLHPNLYREAIILDRYDQYYRYVQRLDAEIKLRHNPIFRGSTI